MSTELKPERRRKTRMAHKVRVVMSGNDADGYNFAEDTETVTVSKNGAAVRTSYTLALGAELAVRVKDTNRAGQFLVVWLGEAGTPSEGRIGLEWVASQRFWGIEFPPEDWAHD
jgi:hypothetical protein